MTGVQGFERQVMTTITGTLLFVTQLQIIIVELIIIVSMTIDIPSLLIIVEHC